MARPPTLRSPLPLSATQTSPTPSAAGRMVPTCGHQPLQVLFRLQKIAALLALANMPLPPMKKLPMTMTRQLPPSPPTPQSHSPARPILTPVAGVTREVSHQHTVGARSPMPMRRGKNARNREARWPPRRQPPHCRMDGRGKLGESPCRPPSRCKPMPSGNACVPGDAVSSMASVVRRNQDPGRSVSPVPTTRSSSEAL